VDLQKAQNMRKEIKLPAHKTHDSEGNSYSLKKRKWRAATLVNTLNMAKLETMAWYMYVYFHEL